MTDLNPIGDILAYHQKVDDHLRGKTDGLLAQMHESADNNKQVSELHNATQNILFQIEEGKKNKNKVELEQIVKKTADQLEVTASLDNKNVLTLDLEGTRWQAYVDTLYDAGKLSTKSYKFTGSEIELFKVELEQQKELLKGESSRLMPMITALMNLLELFSRMTSECVRSNEKLLEKTNNIR